MPKMKSSTNAKKRVKVTGSGKLRRRKAFRSHLLEKKSARRTRRLGRDTDFAPGPGEARPAHARRLTAHRTNERARKDRDGTRQALRQRPQAPQGGARAGTAGTTATGRGRSARPTRPCCTPGNYAFRDRRARKGEFRRLWIQRINAGARAHGLSYSRLIAGLDRAGVEVDRRVLADLAVNDDAAFGALVEVAAKALAE